MAWDGMAGLPSPPASAHIRRMHDDVAELRRFYASPAGDAAGRVVRRRLRAVWPDVSGMDVAGLGYAVPYLAPFAGEARRAVALMPAGQGAERWPPSGGNLAAPVHEDALPLPDLSMDRVLLVHALERTEQLRPLLREVWRVMADGGRMLVVVPNRRGVWARMDHTPFGHGHPYTPRQLRRLLEDSLFAPVGEGTGLYMPPVRSRLVTGSAPAIERLGRRWFRVFGGLLFVEAEKRIHAATPAAAGEAARGAAGAPAVAITGATAGRSPPRCGG